MALEVFTRYYVQPQFSNELYSAWFAVPDQTGLWNILQPLGSISFASTDDALAAVAELSTQIAAYDVDPPAYTVGTWQGIWDPDIATWTPFPVTDTIS